MSIEGNLAALKVEKIIMLLLSATYKLNKTLFSSAKSRVGLSLEIQQWFNESMEDMGG